MSQSYGHFPWGRGGGKVREGVSIFFIVLFQLAFWLSAVWLITCCFVCFWLFGFSHSYSPHDSSFQGSEHSYGQVVQTLLLDPAGIITKYVFCHKRQDIKV